MKMYKDVIILYFKVFMIILIFGYIFPLVINHFVKFFLGYNHHITNDNSIFVDQNSRYYKSFLHMLIRTLHFW